MPVELGPILLLGAGWLGEPLAKRLQADGNKVVVTARRPERIAELQAAGLATWRLDLEDAGESMGLNERIAPFRTIIWAIPPAKKEAQTYAAQLQRLLQHWPAASGRKLVFFSSTGIYPDREGLWDENSEVQDNHRLTEVENLVQVWGSNQLVLRCGGLCDERRIIGRYFSGKILVDADQPVNYIHLADVIGATLHLLTNHATGSYNLVAPQHPPRYKVFEAQAARYGFNPPLELQSGGEKRLISTDKLLSTGYDFIWPDPTSF